MLKCSSLIRFDFNVQVFQALKEPSPADAELVQIHSGGRTVQFRDHGLSHVFMTKANGNYRAHLLELVRRAGAGDKRHCTLGEG